MWLKYKNYYSKDFKEILNALVPNEDYELLHSGENWLFYRPLTQKGASYLGYSTEWCTTWGEYCLNKKNRDRENYFQSQNQGNYEDNYNNIDDEELLKELSITTEKMNKIVKEKLNASFSFFM